MYYALCDVQFAVCTVHCKLCSLSEIKHSLRNWKGQVKIADKGSRSNLAVYEKL